MSTDFQPTANDETRDEVMRKGAVPATPDEGPQSATRRVALGMTAAATAAFLADRAVLSPSSAEAAEVVESVNDKTGKVTLTAADVEAVPAADLVMLPGENLAIGEGAFASFIGESEAEHKKHVRNTAYGAGALHNLTGTSETSTEDNTAIGGRAGYYLTTGGGNTFVGEDAGYTVTTGEENVAIGCEALSGGGTGSSNNIAIGFRSLWVSKATGNVAIGYFAGLENTTATENVYIGFFAGKNNTTEGHNTAVGAWTLTENTRGLNTAVGDAALQRTTAEGNTAVGCAALSYTTSGERNTAIGIFAGNANVTGSGSIFIGSYAGAKVTESNQLVIANNETTPLIAGTLSGTQKLGFYGVTPVAQHAAIAVPAKKTAANTQAITEIIEALQAIGIIA